MIFLETLERLVSTLCIAIVVCWVMVGWTHKPPEVPQSASLCNIDGLPQAQLDRSVIYAGVTADNAGCYVTILHK